MLDNTTNGPKLGHGGPYLGEVEVCLLSNCHLSILFDRPLSGKAEFSTKAPNQILIFLSGKTQVTFSTNALNIDLYVRLWGTKQCDHMLEWKVAQFFPKVVSAVFA